MNRCCGEPRAVTKRPLQAFCSCTAPLLLKYAVTNGRLDEDLYQELCITLVRAIELFRI